MRIDAFAICMAVDKELRRRKLTILEATALLKCDANTLTRVRNGLLDMVPLESVLRIANRLNVKGVPDLLQLKLEICCELCDMIEERNILSEKSKFKMKRNILNKDVEKTRIDTLLKVYNESLADC